MGQLDPKTKEAMGKANEYTNVAFDHLAKLGVGMKRVSLQKLQEMASKQGLSQAAANAARDLLRRASSDHDKKLQRRSARITHNMLVALNKAFPEVDQQLIGDIVADLDSLWDTGQKLDKELKKLFQMRFPQHRSHLADFLAFVEATQIDMVEFWIGNLRKRIPKLRKDLDRQERDERRRTRTKPSKQPRKLTQEMRA